MRQRRSRIPFGGNMRRLTFGLFGLALALAPCHGAVAQEWPNRPVTMIVPFPAGAAVDTLARAVAQVLSEELRQAVHRRQPRRRGRQSRRHGGRQGACRRLHAAVRNAGADRAQQVHVQEPCLRLRAGFYAGRARRQVSDDHHGEARLSGEDPRGADRLCQTEPGQGQCRRSRQRHARTHHLGVDPAVCRRGDDERALPGLGAADSRICCRDKSTSPWISCRPICRWWTAARSARWR